MAVGKSTVNCSLLAVTFSICTWPLAASAASTQQANLGSIKQQIQSNNQPQTLMQQQQGNQQQINAQPQGQQPEQGPQSGLNPQLNVGPQSNFLNQHTDSSGTAGSASGSNTYAPPVLRGLNQNNSAAMTEEAEGNSPVASFFQLAPSVAARQEKGKSGAHKFLWHVMDNIGVPMFVNHDPDIDPSLTRPFVMPPLPSDEVKPTGEPVKAKETIIDPQAAAQDPSTLAPDSK